MNCKAQKTTKGAKLKATLAVLLPLFVFAPWQLNAQLCAEVKLEIAQEATIEREAFDAKLTLSNNYTDRTLDNLEVTIIFKDASGNAAADKFFVKISSLEVVAIDGEGKGTIAVNSKGIINWLIIPSTGAGGTSMTGQKYSVSAKITYDANGVSKILSTFSDTITVKPQPVVKLEYLLPFEVFSDEPLTATVEPVEPFALGVRVLNTGYGAAKNFKIDSGQPVIEKNDQGLDVKFSLLGTYLGDKTIANTFLIPFGDVAPNSVSQASWIMSSTLSGKFKGFDATFSHAAELGGQLTSLIQEVTTYTLIKDVLVALPGRDTQFDFLVNTTSTRGEIGAWLENGVVPSPDVILESDQPEPIPVFNFTAAISGVLSGTNSSLIILVPGVSSNIWLHAAAPLPGEWKLPLVSAKRKNGTELNPRNYWISKHFDKSNRKYSYWLHILDLTSEVNEYAITFDPAALDKAPGAVADLDAQAVAEPGGLELIWTAPGEDDHEGDILGGRYIFQFNTSIVEEFNPELAQVTFATATTPGNLEHFMHSGLIGNATYYIKMWTQDTGGAMSGLSNGATAYILPNPPAGLAVEYPASATAMVSWKIGNNSLPIVYEMRASTDSQMSFAVVSPAFDSFVTSYTFAGLLPNTTYFIRARAFNPETLAASVYTAALSGVTAAEPPLGGGAVLVSSDTVQLSWQAGNNPSGTEYFVQVSTTADWALIAEESGWVVATEYAFAGLLPDTAYYARIKAKNSAGVETVFTDLGALRTKSEDSLPPVTTAGIEGVLGANGWHTSQVTVTLVSTDALSGVKETFYSLDGSTFVVYSSSFQVTAEGAHVLAAYSADNAGNIESAVTFNFKIDVSAPVVEYSVTQSSGSTGGNKTPVDVVFTGADAVSGIAYCSSSMSVTGEGFNLPASGYCADYAGLSSTVTFTVNIDTTAPVTAARVNGQEIPNGSSVTITSGTGLSLEAMDPVAGGLSSGIMAVYYTIDALFIIPATPYNGPFTLPEGQHMVYYAAVDQAGNQELPKSAAFLVTGQGSGGPGTISGTISAQGLPDGSNITILISTDYFRNNVMQFSMSAQGGSLNYNITAPAPGAYSVAAITGFSPGSLIGIYNNYAQVNVTSGSAISDINFSIALDTEPPSSVITSIQDGATIPTLQAIGGMAADNIGVNTIEAAVQDMATQLWWNGQSRQWTPSDTGPIFGDARAERQGPPNNLNWNLQAAASDGALAGLAPNLGSGKTYQLYIRARDLSGNMQQQPVMVSFTWNGGQGQGGQGTISGLISAPGLSDGANVTVLASNDYFRNNVMPFPMQAQGGSLNYSITVPAPGAYTIAAMAGSGPGSLVGIYNNYMQVNMAPDAAVQNINFSLAPDNIPPASSITSIPDGATIPGLGAIGGLATDNVGVNTIEAAVQDTTSQLWWNGQTRQWTQGGPSPAFGDARAELHGPPNNLNWNLRPNFGEGALAGIEPNLANGKTYRLYARARDFSGSVQQSFNIVSFVWNGGQGTPASTYYVDGVSGNDNNNGQNAASAVRTISKAVMLSGVGSTVIVSPGVYHESVAINRTLTLLGAGSAVLDGDTNGDGLRDLQTGFIINSAPGVRLTGFTVRNYFTGAQAMQAGGLVVSSCVFVNNGDTGLQLNNSPGATIEWNVISLNHAGIMANGENLRVRNNTIYSNEAAGITINTQTGFEAVNNIVVNNQWGILVNMSSALDYNDAWGNRDGNYGQTGGNWITPADGLRGPHAISADPYFVDETGGDLRLVAGSPCLGAGANGLNIGYYQGAGVVLPPPPPLAVRHLRDIGGWGTEAGRFSVPTDVAIARWGSAIYVTDSLNFRVQKLTVDGKFISSFGKFGSGPGEFGGPIQTAVGLATGPVSADALENDLVYVADPGNYRVQVFLAGKYALSFGAQGSGPGQFQAVTWVATAHNAGVFVCDELLGRVQVFDGLGAYQYTLGAGLLNRPRAIAVRSTSIFNAAPTLYVVDSANNRIAVFKDQTLTASWNGDFTGATGIHAAENGRVYISDERGWITVYTSAGRYLGKFGAAGPGELEFQQPRGLDTDPAGYLYIADSLNDRVQKVQIVGNDAAAPGEVTPSAVYTSPWYTLLNFRATGDDAQAGKAAWYDVRFTTDGPINTPADFENAAPSYIPYPPQASGGNEMIIASGLEPGNNYNLAVRVYDESGNYFQSGNITAAAPQNLPAGHMVPYAGFPEQYVFRNDGYPAVVAWLGTPLGLAVDQYSRAAGATGLLYVASVQGLETSSLIRSIDPKNNEIATTAGFVGSGYAGDGEAAWRAALNLPGGVAVDAQGNVLIADTANNRIRRVAALTGVITTIAGTGSAGYAGDGGPALAAAINAPYGITTDKAGNIYFAERGNHIIRKIAADGVTSTLCGDGTAGYNGDNMAASAARLNIPTDVKLDQAGNIYITEQAGHRLRRIAAGTGLITTMAGTGIAGIGAENIPAPGTPVNAPAGLAVDPLGAIYFTEQGGHRVRKISAAGLITTIAGTGIAGNSADGPDALTAQLNSPVGVAGDWGKGLLYIADASRVLALGIEPIVIVNVDTAAPVTAAYLDGPQYKAFGLTVISTATRVILTAADAGTEASGVKTVTYEVTDLRTSSTTALVVYTSSFTLPQGTYLIRFHSTDNAGNIETPKELRVGVTPWLEAALVAAGGITTSGNSAIIGQKLSGSMYAAPLYLPNLLENSAAINNNAAIAQYLAGSALTLSGNNSITLSTGTYYLKSLTLSGNAKVLVSGKVELVVDGNVTLSGKGSLNNSAAENLALFISSAGRAEVTGNGALSGYLYGAVSTMTLSGNAVLSGHYLAGSAALTGNAKIQISTGTTSGEIMRVAEFLPEEASAEFVLGEVYVYPNPAKGGQVPTFHIETGIADSVKITIYTVSGSKTHDYTLTGTPPIIDDGNGPDYAYEYAWRGHIASGVYFYFIEAEKAGKKLKKTGRFAVVR